MHPISSLKRTVQFPVHLKQNKILKKIPVPKIEQVNDHPLGRHYAGEDFCYPSITNVLGRDAEKQEILENWKKRMGAQADNISRMAASRGTTMHEALERFVANEEVRIDNLPAKAKDLFMQIRTVLIDLGLHRVICSEDFLISHDLKTAGSVDLVCTFMKNEKQPNKEQIWVVDFKSSAKPKKEEWIKGYFTQVFFYARAFEEMTGLKIAGAIIIVGVDELDKAQVFTKSRTELNDYEPYFNHCYAQYRKDAGQIVQGAD